MQEFSDVEQRKLIWIVVSFCFSIIALLSVLTLAILALFFPLPYAKVLKGIGLNNLALSVYQDVYQSSGDVKDGYAYLMESIYAKYDKHIIIAYEMCKKDAEFSTFLNAIDASNMEKFGATGGLLGSLDEFDYVSGKYVSSLCKMGEKEKAFSFAKENLSNNVANFANENVEKSYLIFDYVATCSNKADLLVVSDEVQTDMQEYALLCSSVVENFLANPSVNGFALALECAVRNVEIYKSFGVLSDANISTIITKEQISQNETSANAKLSNVLKKAVK